ncbi:uncharacterized protein LOC143942759 [Lithobates pipiens]
MKKKNVCFALICLLSCPNGVLFNTQNDEREKIPLKIGENVTLNLPAEYMAVGEVTGVLWAKQDNAFLEISNNTKPFFLNKTFKLKVCSYNVSSITICNATSEDAGMYRANIQYKNKNVNSTFHHKAFYVEHVEELNVAPGYNRTLLDIISKVVEPSVTPGYNRTRVGISSDNTLAITGYVFLVVVLVIIILVICYFVYKKICGQEQNQGNNPSK